MTGVVFVAAGLVAAGLGTLGGLGGAVLLVPLLVLLGLAPADAAPLGLLAVAAGSLGAAPSQIETGLVNHRIGVLTEVSASAGAVTGALAAGFVSELTLTVVLAAAAFLAAAANTLPGRTEHVDRAIDYTAGELPGQLAGVYPDRRNTLPYVAGRVRPALALTAVAGLLAGMTGSGGGFLKTPVLHRIMGVPAKVAAATTTFTVGITAASGLVVFAPQGRIDARAGAQVVLGAILGGTLGAALQRRLASGLVTAALTIALVGVGIALLVRL